MKKILLCLGMCLIFIFKLWSNDPFKRKNWYLEFNYSSVIHQYYQQHSFSSDRFIHGLGMEFGNRKFPLSLSIQKQFAGFNQFQNRQIKSDYEAIGIRYNLNQLTYLIPYGIDPYVGVGLIRQDIQYREFEINDLNFSGASTGFGQVQFNYHLVSGIKFGNNNFTFGFQYEYLPSNFGIESPENTTLNIHHSKHQFSLVAGIRIFSFQRKKVNCPKFNRKQKSTFIF